MIDSAHEQHITTGIQGAGPRDGRWTRFFGRCRVAPGVLRARWDVNRAIRVERRALAALGNELAGATGRCGPGMDPHLAEIVALDSRSDLLRASIADSLRDDRADYAAVAAWMRPLVIGRGFASRSILRHRLRCLRRDREAACVRLGTAWDLASTDAPAVSGPIVNALSDSRSRIAAATRTAEILLAPVGGLLVPGPALLAVGEARAFGQATVREARAQLVPRVPALFGLVAGWWVTSTFTDSQFLATLHSLGIGSGPRRAVNHETLRLLSFSLPLLAAAFCSYLSARLASLVRSRYVAVENAAPVSPTPERHEKV